MAKDPVCGMQVDEKTPAGKSEYKGKPYYFCSSACKTSFDKEPEKFIIHHDENSGHHHHHH